MPETGRPSAPLPNRRLHIPDDLAIYCGCCGLIAIECHCTDECAQADRCLVTGR